MSKKLSGMDAETGAEVRALIDKLSEEQKINLLDYLRRLRDGEEEKYYSKEKAVIFDRFFLIGTFDEEILKTQN